MRIRRLYHLVPLLLALGACSRPADEPCADGCGTIQLAPKAVGDGDFTVVFDAYAPDGTDDAIVTPTVTAGADGGTLRAVVAEGPFVLDGDEPVVLWRQGYQSWSWSGVTELVPLEMTDDGDWPKVGGDGDALSVADETPYTSWWAGLVGRPDGGSLLLGALSADQTKVWFAFDAEGAAWAVWGGRGEEIALGPNESITLDPIRLMFGPDPDDVWTRYAAAVAEAHDVEPRDDVPPVGWGSWTVAYSALTEDDVRRNLDAAKAAFAGKDVGRPVILVDDGWEQRWGDWTANDRFPSGTAQVAADIAAAGFTPGLWMAPFYVDKDAPIYAEHPDWWVGGVDGDRAIVDVTNPDAAAWMHDQVAAKAAEGWSFLKLDFLFAGAQEGTRQEDVTGAEAYARGMAILRDAVGDGYLLACGAPLLPTVGYADGFRTGADIAFEADPDPRPEYLRWETRATAARFFADRTWWWNDPDTALARSPLDDVAVRGSAVATALAGGSYMLGDDLSTLPPDRLAVLLDDDLLAHLGVPAAPIDPLRSTSGVDAGPTLEWLAPDDHVPAAWRFGDGSIGLVNVGTEDVDVAAPPGTEDLGAGSAHVATVRTLAVGDGEVWTP